MIDITVDFEELYALLGAGYAISKIGSGSRYLSDLINAGYQRTEGDFNREVAAFAASTGKLGHMFEWGTVGINKSKSNMKPDPLSERARLWTPHFNYYRGTGTLSFTYRPSVGNVPKPTKAKTGIPGDVLAKLKNHVFIHKAMVMEEGMPVTIKPKSDNKTKRLFVPRIWKGEKGYDMFTKNTMPKISENTSGTFSTYFMAWWETVGNQMINEDVEKAFEQDLRMAMEMIEKTNSRPSKPVKNASGKIDRAERTVLKYLEAAAQERLRASAE